MANIGAVLGRNPRRGFERGQCLPDQYFSTIDGMRKRISDFKGRLNLVVILTDDPDDRLLDAMVQSYPEVKLHEAHIVAVLRCRSTEAVHARDSRRWPFDVVADPGGALHRKFGSEDESGASGLAVYITDRWAEVFFVCRTIDGDPAPNVAEIIDWLTFVDHQCPECFPSEWPA